MELTSRADTQGRVEGGRWRSLDWPGQQILVVVASIHMQHSEGRRGGGFLNNSSCLGVSRNLSARGNLIGSSSSKVYGQLCTR